jgi:hypothetical protein
VSRCFFIALVLAWLPAGGTVLAQARWPDEREAGPFLCHADFSLAGQQPLLDGMAQLQEDLVRMLGAREAREPVHLFLFQTRSTYQAYLKQYFPKVPYRRALYMKARGPGMVFAWQGQDFEIDVRHESTHALLHAWLPSVPLWLDEGLAEYFEVPRDERAEGNPHQASVKALLESGQLPRLEELEAIDDLDQMGRDEYRDAWAWVHYLLHGPREAREELIRYLGELETGGDPGKLSDRLRRRIPDLKRRLVEHFRQT